MKLLLLLALVSASPQQFDLVCSGQSRYSFSDAFKPDNFRLRVNLATKQWCQDVPPGSSVPSCVVLHPIADVQPGVIVFERESPIEKGMGITRAHLVSRTSGEYMHYERDPETGIIDVHAHCDPAPFSGFPNVQTKF